MRRAISRLARLEADARAARALSSSAASASTSGRDRVGTSRAAAVITDLRARRETSWWDRNAARNERREKERLERRDRALAAGDLAAIVDPPRRVALGREKNVLLNRELLNARGAEEILALCVDRRDDFGTFYTLVPIRPRWRGERRSLRTLPGVSLRPPPAFNPRPRRLSTSTDAFQLHPDIIASYGTALSWADLIAYVGVVSIETMGGPAIPFAYGRVDEMDPGKVTPDGRLPDADKGDGPGPKTRAGIREVFNRMGFDDQEIVALSGAHALGRCHADASGYVGPWSGTPTLFNNSYFVLLKGLKWTPNDKAAKFQARSIAHWSPYDRVGVVNAVS